MYRALLIFAITISIMSSIIYTSTASDKWPMYQVNSAHTGLMHVSLDPSKFALRWAKVLGSLDLTPITIANGRIFVSEVGFFNSQHLYTLDATSGNIEWSKFYDYTFSVNPPSYSNGKVYVQTCNNDEDTYLRVYDAATGALIFRSNHRAQWERYFSPTIYDDKVYIDGGNCGGLYSFDAIAGEQEWFYELPQYDQWTPAVDDNYAYSYVGEYEPALYVIDRLTGELAFQIPDPEFSWNGWSMDLAPVLGGMSDVLAIHDGRLIRFDLEARSIGWVNRANFKGQPTVANGVVYAINAGALGAYEQRTGELLWMWEAPGSGALEDTIVATDSHLFVHTDATTYCIDLASRKDVWSYPAAGHLSLGESGLYIAGAEGSLTAIGLGLPDLSTPESIAFENTDLGQTASKTMVLRNVGDAPLQVSGITSDSAEFAAEAPPTPFTIAAHQSESIVVHFSPIMRGRKTQTITVKSDDPNESEMAIPVTATSLAAHTLTASAGTGGRIAPEGQVSVVDGDSVTFAISPDPDFKISEAIVDGGSVGATSSYTFSNVTSDHTISAIFAPIPSYTVSASATAGWKIQPSGRISAREGDSLTLAITADPGYQLSSLTVDGAVVGNSSSYTFSNVVADHTILAEFERYFDYFGVAAGNRMIYAAKYANGNSGIARSDITLDTLTYPYATYLNEQSLDGVLSSVWYQVTSDALFMLQQTDTGNHLTFTPGLPVVQTPLGPKANWNGSATFILNGLGGTAKITAKASPMVLVSVPAGHFMAYPISYTLKLAARGRTSSTSWKDYFSPYFGSVKTTYSKSKLKSVQLTEFAVGEGSVTTPPPVVVEIVPKSAARGSTVLINGYQFGSSQGSSTLRIGGVQCDQILSWSDASIECVVPEAAVSGPVTVATDAWSSNESVPFTVIIPPVVTAVDPPEGKRGSVIQIHGQAFGTAKGKVKIGKLQGKILQWGDGSITCTVPAKAPLGISDVTVINGQGQSVLQDAFTVVK